MDTACDNVYTEWDEVKQFAEDFVGRLVFPRRGKDDELERVRKVGGWFGRR
jgi:hypothetical protein